MKLIHILLSLFIATSAFAGNVSITVEQQTTSPTQGAVVVSDSTSVVEKSTLFEMFLPYIGLVIPLILGLIAWYFKSWITFQFQKRLVRYKKKVGANE